MIDTTNALRLRITHPDGSVQDTSHDGENVILGSGPGAAIQLPDPRVSPLHVMLKLESSKLLAIDLGSEHGTHLGGQRLVAPCTLRPGDVLTLGSSQVRVLPEEVVQLGLGVLRPASALHAVPVTGMPLEPRRRAGRGNLLTLAPLPDPLVEGPVVASREAVWRLLSNPTPLEARPTADQKALQVSLAWGSQLMGVQHFAEGVAVRIGEGRDCQVQVPGEGLGSGFVVAKAGRSSAKLVVPPGAEVRARVAGRDLDTPALRARGLLRDAPLGDTLELGMNDTVQIGFEHLNLIVRFVKPPLHVPGRELSRGDSRFLAVALLCLVLFGAGLFALVRVSIESLDAANALLRSAQYVQVTFQRPPPPRPARNRAKPAPTEGAKAKDDEGKLGKREAVPHEADPSLPGTPVVRRSNKENDRTRVMKAGLVGLLNKNPGTVANVFGPGGVGSGINRALGGLKAGAGLTDAHGVGGAAPRGAGTGGGGTGLGIGGLGTQGLGTGTKGYGRIDLGGGDKEVVRVIPGKTNVVGGLSKEVIARVIKQHQGEIKYCYEAQLNQQRDLSGKVAVRFEIDGSGAVADANVSESTLGSSTAEQCMMGKIRRWRFPEPAGGGSVTVTFPWVFKPSGGGTVADSP